MNIIQIGDKKIGPRHPVFVIGEVAQAHEGSLNLAHAFIEAISEAGADAVKFQTHIADAESTPAEKPRNTRGWLQESWKEYWQRTAFTEEEWEGLAEHSADRGLVFLSSPFSVKAAQLLNRVGVHAWKIASGEVTNFQMFEFMAETKKPFLLSTGMSDWAEQNRVVGYIKDLGAPLGVFQCTTAYPTQPEEVGLNLMDEIRERYDIPVGLSDHSGSVVPGLAAVSLGANMLEVHVTLSREMPNAIIDSCLTVEEFGGLVEGVRMIERMLNSPLDKDRMASEKAPLREVFFRSVVASQDLAAGTTLSDDNLTSKKPGVGIPADRINTIVGRKLARDVKKDQLLAEEDIA